MQMTVWSNGGGVYSHAYQQMLLMLFKG